MAARDADLLARSDAVLALSMNTINAQLKMLLNRGIIRRRWAMAWLNNLKTGEVLADDSPDAAARIAEWKQIRTAAGAAQATGDWATIGMLMSQLKKDYSGAWDAYIKGVYVEAVPGAPKQVLLKLHFGAGSLIMSETGGLGVTELDMKDVVYAFKTPLSQYLVSVGKDEMIPDAEKNTKEFMKRKGLSSDHFTVEALFMDIQRANVANFEKESVLPNESSAIASAITTVFNQIIPADEQRKYVLGYSLQRKQLKEIGEAVFQPTAAVYSTTYVPKDAGQTLYANKESSFNFHMMVQNHTPDKTSVLPTPLLSGRVADPEVDGVYALRYSLFENEIIDPLVRTSLSQVVKEYTSAGVQEPDPGREWRVEGSKKYMNHDNDLNIKSDDFKNPEKHVREAVSATATVQSRNGNLEILFEISYSYEVEYKAWRFTGFVEEVGEAIGNFFTGKKQEKVGGYETILKATSTTKVGKTGRILVLIQPGELGKLKAVAPKKLQELDVDLKDVSVSPHFNDFGANFEALFSGDLNGWIRKKVRAAVQKARPTDALDQELNEKMSKAIRLSDDVNALSIVMPLGNVYTFKDLALASNNSSKILVARAGYAPIEEASS